MSNQAMTWALKQDIQPTGAKFVFVMLANYANGDGYCYAGQGRIATDTGQSERSVRGHLADLESAGWITRERRNHKSGQRAVDGFYLVGFSDNQPATFAGSQAAEPAGSQPENTAGRDGDPTGNFRQTNRQLSPLLIRNEPTIEPTIAESPEIPPNGHAKKACDERWDTLVAYHGFSPTPDTPEHGRWNKAVGIWRKIQATPQDMDRAYRLYRKRYPKAAITVLAVAGRAEELLNSQPPPAFDDGYRPLSDSWDD